MMHILDYKYHIPFFLGLSIAMLDIVHVWVIFLAYTMYSLFRILEGHEVSQDYFIFLSGYLAGLGIDTFIYPS